MAYLIVAQQFLVAGLPQLLLLFEQFSAAASGVGRWCVDAGCEAEKLLRLLLLKL